MQSVIRYVPSMQPLPSMDAAMRPDDGKRSIWHKAVLSPEPKKQLLALKKSHQYVDSLNEAHLSPLALACLHSIDLDAIDMLLEMGAKPSGLGIPAIFLACLVGASDTVSRLLEYPVDLNMTWRGCKLVELAQSLLDERMVQLFLNAGAAETSTFSELQQNPRPKGQNPPRTPSRVQPDMQEPFLSYCQMGALADCLELLNIGVNVYAHAKRQENALQMAYDRGHFLLFCYLARQFPLLKLARNNSGQTIFHHVVQKGDLAAAALLLRLHTGPHIVNSLQVPPLFCVDEGPCCFDLLMLLKRYGADLDYRDLSYDTFLTWACMGGKIELVRQLIQCGADRNPKGSTTPLHVATGISSLAIVQLLFDRTVGTKPADPDIEFEHQRPFGIALEKLKEFIPLSWHILGSPECKIVQAFISAGVDLSYKYTLSHKKKRCTAQRFAKRYQFPSEIIQALAPAHAIPIS